MLYCILFLSEQILGSPPSPRLPVSFITAIASIAACFSVFRLDAVQRSSLQATWISPTVEPDWATLTYGQIVTHRPPSTSHCHLLTTHGCAANDVKEIVCAFAQLYWLGESSGCINLTSSTDGCQ